MSAIESFSDRVADGILFRVIDDHRRPRDGLERQPMQTDCATKRKNCDDATNPAKHATRLCIRHPDVNSGDGPVAPFVVPCFEVEPVRDWQVGRIVQSGLS